jgi:S1-C subfamily serine protease
MEMISTSSRASLGKQVFFLLLACLFTGAMVTSLFAATPEMYDVRRDATVLAVEQVMPSVVNIATKNVVQVRDPFDEFYRQFFGRQSADQPYSLGSGVVIDEAGYLLTNDHVVRRADKIAVKFATGGDVYEATVVASDSKSDVALLKLTAHPGEKFHAIKIAHDDDLLLGETVLALGNPFGLGGSVSRGILSSKSRVAPKEGQPLILQNCLQTDAAINPGSSGGPLVNLRGELIGINVQYVPEAQSLGFAVPVKRVIESLSEEIFPTDFVSSFWFGARVKVGTSPLTVMAVQPESPAGRAGLKSGDVILTVNGKAPKSFIDFAGLLAEKGASDQVLTIQRGLERNELNVRLVPTTNVFNAEMVRNKLGLNLDSLTAETAARYGVNATAGFIVTGVLKDSPAEAAHLQNGMLVTGVNGQTPPDLTALAKMLYGKAKGESVRLDIGMLQPFGNFNALLQGNVELISR